MKVIDLLNKIANGKEVPKKVKFAGIIFEYDENERMYFTDNYKNICDYVYLDNEVQILEEEKKIPEKLDKYADISGDLAYDWTFGEKKLKDKINEIIDYLDCLKSKGE